MLSSDMHRVCTYWVTPTKNRCTLPVIHLDTVHCCDKVTNLEAKVLFVGYSGVGKTCLVVRYVGNMFNKHVSPTIGASFFTCKMVFENYRVKLQVWDTAGQERFRSMAPMYYRKSNAAMLVYDITNEESFEDIKNWVHELKKNVDGRMVLCVLGNKCDLTSERQVSREEAQEYASSIGAEHFETSALTNEGIQETFSHVARELITLYEQVPDSGLHVMDATYDQARDNRGRIITAGATGLESANTGTDGAPPSTGGCCS